MNKDLHLYPLDFPLPFTLLLFLLFSNVLGSRSRNSILLFLYIFCSAYRRSAIRPFWEWHRLSTVILRADTAYSVNPSSTGKGLEGVSGRGR